MASAKDERSHPASERRVSASADTARMALVSCEALSRDGTSVHRQNVQSDLSTSASRSVAAVASATSAAFTAASLASLAFLTTFASFVSSSRSADALVAVFVARSAFATAFCAFAFAASTSTGTCAIQNSGRRHKTTLEAPKRVLTIPDATA